MTYASSDPSTRALDIVLGGTTDDVLTPGAPGTGKWTFSKGSHQPITFQNMKTQAQCRLLSATELPVTTVCLAVGFESLGAFSWLFRRRLGVSPRDFRGRRNPQD